MDEIVARSRRERATISGEGLAWRQGPHRPHSFQGRGEEIVPSKEPLVVRLTVSNQRSLRKLPVAPANRPVPPVMVAVSSM